MVVQACSKEKDVVLSVENLSVNYTTKHGDVPAVRDVRFPDPPGEALASWESQAAARAQRR
jgi:ABC-type glutathione transport system ATPase component